MSAYVYIKSELGLWTAGFYRPDGGWEPETDHHSAEAAARRVHWLNGGTQVSAAAQDLLEALKGFRACAEYMTASEPIATVQRLADAAIRKAEGR